MFIPKDQLQKIQAEIDAEKKNISNQLYLTLCTLMKRLFEPDSSVKNLQEQVADLADFHLSQRTFQSVREMADYLSQFKETLIFIKPYLESLDQQSDMTTTFMYL